MDMDAANESENIASLYSDFEGDFEQTILLLDMDVEEVEIQVQKSFEEVQYGWKICINMIIICLVIV